MLLKKQTVWLLTMLSLVVVLSVYYITSPEPNQGNLATVDEQEEQTVTEEQKETTESQDGETVISGVASDEQFEALRLNLEDQRSEMKEEYQEIVASTDLPVEQRNDAYEKMKELDSVSQKESVLETLIKTMGYEDALVRADGEKVRVTVKAKEHSAAEANEIIQMVRNELGSLQAVAVTFQPEK
ncbi:SpoIIIAH-like family protein [Mesobacillus maritimus]|uniref:SpoIIIAH-like family protein n=1 Tax=Mesobacillus maritimus TaxID=1643336 RepID=UPI00203CDAED|nr:SpoIIIAH-like family protein [Mesobacillus maritimus]MCM3586379.1 SpoIIIAH-like family protein [Mesobacillus maritimus]MCM3669589.1 SpoIIIAH-like family protein [Mesobacillus maritimus]